MNPRGEGVLMRPMRVCLHTFVKLLAIWIPGIHFKDVLEQGVAACHGDRWSDKVSNHWTLMFCAHMPIFPRLG